MDLREVRLGGREIINRIYIAVRDANWNTLPVEIEAFNLSQRAGGFDATLSARCRGQDVDFAWDSAFSGRPSGDIVLDMRGQALRDFRFCRIGFCVLLPDGLAGTRYQVRTPVGVHHGVLPELIAPQPIADGFEVPMAPAGDRFTLLGNDGLAVSLEFEGDLFELEDQRNWTDGSFKIYGTPIGLGYPHSAVAGDRFEQRVVVRVGGDLKTRRNRARQAPVALRMELDRERRAPLIGVGASTTESQVSHQERQLLAGLHLDHLRVDLRLGRPEWHRDLEHAAMLSTALGCAVEVASYLPAEGDGHLRELVDRLADVPVARLIIFDEATAITGVTPEGLGQHARSVVKSRLPGVAVVGGTDGDFAELNRARPSATAFDGIVYSMNPQVHLFDDESLMDTISGQAATVRTARTFSQGRPIIVSPITLRPRHNPAATERADTSGAGVTGGLLSDSRQSTLLCAAWTLGSIASLSAAGAQSMTYFEAVGSRGVLGAATNSVNAHAPQSVEVFPVYHVLADLATRHRGRAVPIGSSAPRKVSGVAFRHDGTFRALAANLTCDDVQIRFGPLQSEHVIVRRLDESSLHDAMEAPESFRGEWLRINMKTGHYEDALPAMSCVAIEGSID